MIVTLSVCTGTAACTNFGPEKKPDSRPTVTGTAPVIIPGGPGSPARTATPGERVGPSTQPPGPADVLFAQRMIPHHQQAIEMATMAKERSGTTEIRGLAARIIAAQNPEIAALRSWLRRHRYSTVAAGAHAGMPGMATSQQLGALRTATGKEFDEQFLRLMIAHHEGALHMAVEELTGGRDPFLVRMARDVHASQSAEIRRMRTLLAN